MDLLSEAGTAMFMSRSFTMHLTEAPASQHTRANVLSVGIALVWSLPDGRHAA